MENVQILIDCFYLMNKSIRKNQTFINLPLVSRVPMSLLKVEKTTMKKYNSFYRRNINLASF